MAFVRTDTGSTIVANHRASGPMGVASSRRRNYHFNKPQSEAETDHKVCSQRNFQNLQAGFQEKTGGNQTMCPAKGVQVAANLQQG